MSKRVPQIQINFPPTPLQPVVDFARNPVHPHQPPTLREFWAQGILANPTTIPPSSPASLLTPPASDWANFTVRNTCGTRNPQATTLFSPTIANPDLELCGKSLGP